MPVADANGILMNFVHLRACPLMKLLSVMITEMGSVAVIASGSYCLTANRDGELSGLLGYADSGLSGGIVIIFPWINCMIVVYKQLFNGEYHG